MSITPLRPGLEVYEAHTPSAVAGERHASDAAIENAAAITRARAKNFYYGLRLAPPEKRAALYAMYAWMREGDDIVDDEAPLADRRDAFKRFRQKSLRAFDGVTLSHDTPWWRAFADTCSRFPLSRAALGDMLDGLAEDLQHAPYATEADVDRYCRRVGSSVGVLCVNVWGLRPNADAAHAISLAVDRGIAFQRTNILRDIAEDARDGRSYLSAEMLDRHALSRDDLITWSPAERCEALIAELASTARDHYARSAGLERMISRDCVPVLHAMTDIYSAVLRCVERRPARAVLGPRARVSKRRKLLIATAATFSHLAPGPWL